MSTRVPNQRVITVKKEVVNKENKDKKYTVNTLYALDEAAKRLQTKGGFKLYMYLAKNQDKYRFNLSSSDFMLWSGLGYKAYLSAFAELVDEGYLITKEGLKDVYTFYEKSQAERKEEGEKVIEVPPEKVKEVQKISNSFEF